MSRWRLSEAAFEQAGPDGDKPGKNAVAAGRSVFYGFVAYSVLAHAAGAKGTDETLRTFAGARSDPTGPGYASQSSGAGGIGGLLPTSQGRRGAAGVLRIGRPSRW